MLRRWLLIPNAKFAETSGKVFVCLLRFTIPECSQTQRQHNTQQSHN